MFEGVAALLVIVTFLIACAIFLMVVITQPGRLRATAQEAREAADLAHSHQIRAEQCLHEIEGYVKSCADISPQAAVVRDTLARCGYWR